MKTIGLIGGMSCESTAHYYARLNEGVRAALGGLHSAEILMWSVDFAPIAAMQAQDRWQEAGVHLATIAKRLEAAGAEVLVLATNTMHKVADTIEAAVGIPFLHIADATALKICAAGKHRRIRGFHGNNLKVRFFRLDKFAHACQRAACSHP